MRLPLLPLWFPLCHVSGLPPVERGQKCSVPHAGHRETSCVCSSLLPCLLPGYWCRDSEDGRATSGKTPSPQMTPHQTANSTQAVHRASRSLPLCWAFTCWVSLSNKYTQWTKQTDPEKHKIPWCSTASLSASPGLGDTARTKRVPLCASGNCLSI